MDDAALQEQLRRIKHRQYLIHLILCVPYLYLVAEYIGFELAGVVHAVIGVLSFGASVAYRRRMRNMVGSAARISGDNGTNQSIYSPSERVVQQFQCETNMPLMLTARSTFSTRILTENEGVVSISD